MTSSLVVEIDEARKRAAADPSHTYAQHLAAIVAEKDVERNPLSLPRGDAEKHRFIAYISATRFVSYAAAAEIFTRDILPKLQQFIAVREEQAELARRVAAVQPPRVFTAAELRLAQRLERKNAAKRAAAGPAPSAEPEDAA